MLLPGVWPKGTRMEDDPKPPVPTGSEKGIPPDGNGRDRGDDEGVAFDPEAVSSPDAAAGMTGMDGEDSGASHTSRVLIGTGRSGIDAASDVVPESSSVKTGPRFLEDVEGAAASSEKADAAPSDHDAEEWHDVAEAPRDAVASESIGFGPFLGSQEAIEQGGMADSCAGDSQGIGESVGPTLDFQSAAGSRAERRSSPRRAGGPGQIVGVVLGGMLAVPVTLAILLWGFQRDPLGVAAAIPEPLQFLLPRKLLAAPARRSAALRPSSSGLDEIAAEATRVARKGSPGPAPAEEIASIEPIGEGDLPFEPPSSGIPPAAVAAIDPVAIPVEPPPIDPVTSGGRFDALDAAVARAIAATESLDEPSDDRDAALVAWYRDLADAAREATTAEKKVMDVGSASGEVVARVEPLARRLIGSHLGTLEEVGAMWLSSVRRPSEGVVLVATLEESRPVGPWWGGQLSIRGDMPRSITFLGGTAPRVSPGERLLVAGVLVDSGTMWIVATWAAPASGD